MNQDTRRLLAAAMAAATALAVPACKSETAADNDQAEASGPSGQTLAAMVAGADGLSTVSEGLKDAGLVQVFDGTAPYTVLAPRDAAFEKLGEAGADLKQPEQRAALAAILRDHILPGYLTPEDIGKAIDRAAGNSVKMKTMGDHVVSFARDGDVIVATQADGATARFAGDALLAGNGVAIPVDGVLKKVA